MQPRLRPTNKTARLSSRGGNVWTKTIYTVPERPSDRAKSYGCAYGNTAEEAAANAARICRLHNVTREIEHPHRFIANAKETVNALKEVAHQRFDIDVSKPILPQLINLLQQ